ncbi:MAG: hypothetical protein KIS92_06590 [Planctomycetota bacterium]|nr:hypothetical protein [Planctomycetota bacterium]
MTIAIDEDVCFERFVERHERTLRNYAERCTGDSEKALKVTLEALQELFKRREKLKNKDLLIACFAIIRKLAKVAPPLPDVARSPRDE